MISIDQAVEIRKGEEIDLNVLNEYISKESSVIEEIVSIKQFPGGFSNLTYELVGINKKYVLRKPPKGAKAIKGGHDMIREFRILSEIKKSGFDKIPNTILACENEDILGSEFYIMEKVEGIILRAHDAKNLIKTVDLEVISKLSRSICEQQAQLHLIPIEENELANIGKPEGFVERQVSGWTKRYLHSQTDEIPEMTFACDWLAKNIPSPQKATLLHNDFKYDNLVLNPEKLEDIKAILDWEMTTIGDPLMDLGATLAYWVEANDDDFLKSFNLSWIPGNLSRKEYIALYAQKTGFDVSNILFYYVFGLIKNAVIIQQIYARYKSGLTQDPRFAGLIHGVKVLAKKAKRSIEVGELV